MKTKRTGPKVSQQVSLACFNHHSCKESMDRAIVKHTNSRFGQSGPDQAPGILLHYRENKEIAKCYCIGCQRHEPRQAGKAFLEANLSTASLKNNSNTQVRGSHRLWAVVSKRGAQLTCWCLQYFLRLAKFIENRVERPSYCHSPSLDRSNSKSLTCSGPTAWDKRALVFYRTAGRLY